MSFFLNSPAQLSSMVDLGTLTSAGSAAAALTPSQNFAISPASAGSGAAALAFQYALALAAINGVGAAALALRFDLSLITAGAGAATLNPALLIRISPVAAGVGAAALTPKQNHALSPVAAGVGAASLSFGVTNGINLAIAQGSSLASLYLGQEINDLLFATGGSAQITALLRKDNEPNLFMSGSSAGGSTASLNLKTEIILFFRSEGRSTATYSQIPDLIQPDPILNEIAAGAFQAHIFKSRLLVNGEPVKFKTFDYLRPKGSLSSSLSITLAKPELAQIPKDALYSFILSKKVAGVWQDTPIMENATLDARNYTLAFLGDSLNFAITDAKADRLSRSPAENFVCYDGLKIEITNELESVFDTDGNAISTSLRNIPALSIHKLLKIAFVDGCGFSAIETNLPDDLVIQCAFSYKTTFLEAISGVIGIFKPLFFMVGDTLWILNKNQTIPAEFAPQEIPLNKILSYEASIRPARQIDGYEISFLGSKSYGSTETELVQKTEPHGSFGADNYTETEINKTFKNWKDGAGRKLHTELLSEQRITTKGATVIEESEELYFYDGQGKQTETRKTRHARLPSLPSGTLSSQLVKSYIKEYFYQTDPFNIKRQILARATTQISGLYAIDSVNQQLGADYKRDFERVAESGNLIDTMTTDSGDLITINEAYVPIGNGQVRVYTSGTDHLAEAPLEPSSDLQNGDISLNAVSAKPLKMVIYRDGVTAENKTRPIVPFNIGELNLFYGLPLAENELRMELAQLQDASIKVAGFEESLDRGVYFSLGARGIDLGRFITEQIRISGDSRKLITSLEVSEI